VTKPSEGKPGPVVKVQLGYLCTSCRCRFLVKCPEAVVEPGKETVQIFLESIGWRQLQEGWKCGSCTGIRGEVGKKLEGMAPGTVKVLVDPGTGRILHVKQAKAAKEPPKKVSADDIRRLLRAVKFSYSTEKELQAGIERVLKGAGVPCERERKLAGDLGVIDFLVGRIGIEIKTKGSPSQVARQLIRYCKSDELDAIILVTGRVALGDLPQELGGKKIFVLSLWGTFL
jgi:hypothetical protein